MKARPFRTSSALQGLQRPCEESNLDKRASEARRPIRGQGPLRPTAESNRLSDVRSVGTGSTG